MSVDVGRLQQEAPCVGGEDYVPIKFEGHGEAASGRMKSKVRIYQQESETT